MIRRLSWIGVLLPALFSAGLEASVITSDGKWIVSGKFTAPIVSFEGQTSGILTSLGYTGPITFSIDTQKQSSLTYNFDEGRIDYTVFVLATASALGISPVPIEIVESGIMPSFHFVDVGTNDPIDFTHDVIVHQPGFEDQTTIGQSSLLLAAPASDAWYFQFESIWEMEATVTFLDAELQDISISSDNPSAFEPKGYCNPSEKLPCERHFALEPSTAALLLVGFLSLVITLHTCHGARRKASTNGEAPV